LSLSINATAGVPAAAGVPPVDGLHIFGMGHVEKKLNSLGYYIHTIIRTGHFSVVPALPLPPSSVYVGPSLFHIFNEKKSFLIMANSLFIFIFTFHPSRISNARPSPCVST
jgi:hypothetical protein